MGDTRGGVEARPGQRESGMRVSGRRTGMVLVPRSGPDGVVGVMMGIILTVLPHFRSSVQSVL